MLSQVARFHACFMVDYYLVVLVGGGYHILFVHSSVDGYIGCFPILAFVNDAEMNLEMHISFQYDVVISFGYMP